MSDIRFYHLERQNLDHVLPQLLTKALAQGHKILVKTPNETESERINKHLWAFDPNSFLPHGTDKDKDKYKTNQPVFITHNDENPNTASVLILTHNEKVEDLNAFDLICNLFDGRNEETLSAARNFWKSLKDEDKHDLTYWQQDANGKWDKKA